MTDHAGNLLYIEPQDILVQVRGAQDNSLYEVRECQSG
jgi:hypothetical protein